MITQEEALDYLKNLTGTQLGFLLQEVSYARACRTSAILRPIVGGPGRMSYSAQDQTDFDLWITFVPNESRINLILTVRRALGGELSDWFAAIDSIEILQIMQEIPGFLLLSQQPKADVQEMANLVRATGAKVKIV